MDDAATTRLLVWDEPDMRRALASVLVWEPTDPADVDLTAVYLWLAARCQDGQEPEANLFALVEPGSEATVAEHITSVRASGFGVVARPARPGSTSLTPALSAHLAQASAQGRLAEVVVASHDGDGLRPTLEQLAGNGVTVTVVGFRERAGFAADSAQLHFFDLEDVAGAFTAPLPRTNLYDLPDDGLALPPLHRPSSSAADRPGPSGIEQPVRAAAGLAVGLGPDPAAIPDPGDEPVETPPSGPSTAGALDDLLAGVQATPLASEPAPPTFESAPPSFESAPPSAASGLPLRPGRVSPPNGETYQD